MVLSLKNNLASFTCPFSRASHERYEKQAVLMTVSLRPSDINKPLFWLVVKLQRTDRLCRSLGFVPATRWAVLKKTSVSLWCHNFTEVQTACLDAHFLHPDCVDLFGDCFLNILYLPRSWRMLDSDWMLGSYFRITVWQIVPVFCTHCYKFILPAICCNLWVWYGVKRVFYWSQLCHANKATCI